LHHELFRETDTTHTFISYHISHVDSNKNLFDFGRWLQLGTMCKLREKIWKLNKLQLS